jgi:hypothetical protein
MMAIEYCKLDYTTSLDTAFTVSGTLVIPSVQPTSRLRWSGYKMCSLDVALKTDTGTKEINIYAQNLKICVKMNDGQYYA